MKKLGPREAQLRALREAQFAEGQRQRKAQEPQPAQSQPMANALPHPVTSRVTSQKNKQAMSVAARQKRWRENHPALHRNRHAAYMRKWRAAKKEAVA